MGSHAGAWFVPPNLARTQTLSSAVAPVLARDHFVNVARRRAAEAAQASQGGGFFADQFENPANFRAHYEARRFGEFPYLCSLSLTDVLAIQLRSLLRLRSKGRPSLAAP